LTKTRQERRCAFLGTTASTATGNHETHTKKVHRTIIGGFRCEAYEDTYTNTWQWFVKGDKDYAMGHLFCWGQETRCRDGGDLQRLGAP